MVIKILLIGAGNVHQSVLRHLEKEKLKDAEISLISSSKSVGVNKRCDETSVTFIEDTVISFDPLQKMLLGFSGEIYRFDVISFDIDMKYSLFKQALVPVAENGAMQVQDTLQNTEFPFLFGAGHCVSIAGHNKEATYTEKQGIVLWNNMRRYIGGQKLKPIKESSKLTSFMNWLNGLLN